MFGPVTSSILGRAAEKGLLEISVVNIRDYTLDKHRKTDDTPFGGGAGMVMTPQPAFDALRACGAEGKRILYMSPRGPILDQQLAESRLIPGVLGSGDSLSEESIYSGLLEYPQYTKPRSYDGMDVPEVLFNGNHKLIHLWQYEQSLRLTAQRRPDLLQRYLAGGPDLTKDEKKILERVLQETQSIE